MSDAWRDAVVTRAAARRTLMAAVPDDEARASSGDAR